MLRPHVRRVLRPALVLLVLAPAAAFAAGVVAPGAARAPVRLVVTALTVLVALRWVVWPFLLWWNTLYVLTDERFVERSGIARRTGHDLPLQGVADVIVAQRFGERLLRSGTLRITTDGGGELVVTDVPAVARVERSLLAVADDIGERLRAPRRRAEEVDEAGDPRPEHEAGEPTDAWVDAWDDAWEAEDLDGDAADGPPAPSRSEARRRERESRRRLAEIQAQVRRTPAPDSPLEEGGDERGQPAPARPPAPAVEEGAGEAADEGPDPDRAVGDGFPDDDAGGARILRFPPRP